MVMYELDINYILTEAMKNCEGESIINVYETLYNILATKGFKPQFQKLDNEAPYIFIQSLQDKTIDFQFVPPNMHHLNSDEWVIRIFKNYFISGLCSVNPNFPLQIWCRLLYQETTTMNLMRKSIINQDTSARE